MVLNLTKTVAVPGRVCTDGNTFIGFTCGPLTKCWSFSSTKTVTIVWDVWLNRLIGCSTVWTPMSVLPNSVAKFWSSYSALDCLILVKLWGGKHCCYLSIDSDIFNRCMGTVGSDCLPTLERAMVTLSTLQWGLQVCQSTAHLGKCYMSLKIALL